MNEDLKTCYIEKNVHKRLKHRAVERESTIQEELDKILKKELFKNES